MAYNQKEIFNKALKVITKNNLYFIEDVVAFLPCDKTTFYRFFEVESNEYNAIKELLDQNRINAKVGLRKKWNDSDNATLQIGLYKLIGSEDERKKLNSAYIDQKTEHTGEITITRVIKK